MERNLINEYVDFVRNNLTNYAEMIMGKYYNGEIFNKYLNKYIDIRYYNLEPWMGNDLTSHLNYYLNKVYLEEESDISKFIFELFKKFYFIDNVDNIEIDLNDFLSMMNIVRTEKIGINEDDFIDKFSKMLSDDNDKKEKFISLFDNDDFSLKMNTVPNYNIYDVTITHAVSVPKIFSNYAVSQVWNSKKVNEGKIKIEYYLISSLLLKNIITCNYNDNYLVDFPISIVKNDDKMKSYFNIFNNEIGKEKIVIKISYGDFIANKDNILFYIKDGFQFAIILDEEYLQNKNANILNVFKYVIIVDDKYLDGDVKGLHNIVKMI